MGLRDGYDVARSQQSREHLPNFGFLNSLLCKSTTESGNLSLIAKADVYIQAETSNSKPRISVNNEAVRFKQRSKGFHSKDFMFPNPTSVIKRIVQLHLQLDALRFDITDHVLPKSL